jgi:hypothetical protein
MEFLTAIPGDPNMPFFLIFLLTRKRQQEDQEG